VVFCRLRWVFLQVSEWDLANEFNPQRHHRKRSKEDAIYGIFNDSDDEDGGDARSDKGKRSVAGAGNVPMRFVAGKGTTLQRAGQPPS
jgi:tuftelin-interacting protein 11